MFLADGVSFAIEHLFLAIHMVTASLAAPREDTDREVCSQDPRHLIVSLQPPGLPSSLLHTPAPHDPPHLDVPFGSTSRSGLPPTLQARGFLTLGLTGLSAYDFSRGDPVTSGLD